MMRTTLEIDDDILYAAKDLCSKENLTLGKAISELARRGLNLDAPLKKQSGFPVFPRKSDVIVTMEFVNQLRDELP